MHAALVVTAPALHAIFLAGASSISVRHAVFADKAMTLHAG